MLAQPTGRQVRIGAAPQQPLQDLCLGGTGDHQMNLLGRQDLVQPQGDGPGGLNLTFLLICWGREGSMRAAIVLKRIRIALTTSYFVPPGRLQRKSVIFPDI